MDQDELAGWLELIEALLTIGISAWMLWTMIPQHQRTAARMRLLMTAQGMTGRLARRTGDSSMAAELATGQPNYWLPYLLSVCRDRLGLAYDHARGITL